MLSAHPAAEADLVVLGFGAAGSAAAITAADRGADVILLEKQPKGRHTPSVRMSGGLVMTVTDASKAAPYMRQCAGDGIPAAITNAWAERAADLLRWCRDSGIDAGLTRCSGAEHHFPGGEAIDVYQPGNSPIRLDPSTGGGRTLFAAIERAVETRGRIRVLYDSPAARLDRDQSGRVTGVVTAGGRTICARRGVVLATGGFEGDEEMKRTFLPAYPTYFYSNPANTGDGLRMAQAVGAGLWNMNKMVGRGIGAFPLEDGGRLPMLMWLTPPGYVITDRYGHRFYNEYSQATGAHSFYYQLLTFDTERAEYSRIPCFWIFDETRREAGPLTLPHIGAMGVGIYSWSFDNEAEIARGWIKKGRTVAEAAATAGIEDPDQAERTVAEYNAACAAGHDLLGRPAESLVALDSPPYYCVPLYPGGSNTGGGPRRDERARILDAFGAPIPGLFGAGELGQAIGMLYPADGANISEALCFGQIAAETALAS